MHTIKAGLVGQTYAFAASNDSGSKKSRIRRSKEERKAMVESFIKKYQKSNDGNFPSLNLTHKEVGGSFYTVREIVREIIQENRVLAPPKDENDHFDFLDQHPLGSISVEPEMNFSVSHGLQSETYKSSSVMTFHESDPSKLENKHKDIDGLRKGPEKDKVFDSTGHSLPNYCQHAIVEDSNASEQFQEPKVIIDADEVIEEIADSNKTQIADHAPTYKVETNESAPEIGHVRSEPGNQKLVDEPHNNQDQTIGKTEEFDQRIHKESGVKQIADIETSRANDVDPSKVVESHTDSTVVVETFPLRPVHRTLSNIGINSGNVQELTGTDDVKHASVQSSSDSGNEKDEIKLPHSVEKLNDELQDKKILVNLQEPSLESTKKYSSSTESIAVATDVESKDSLLYRDKVSSLITEQSNAVGSKTNKDTGTFGNQSNPTLDRVHLETWKRTSKTPTEPETNPLLAFVKALVSAFVKLWN